LTACSTLVSVLPAKASAEETVSVPPDDREESAACFASPVWEFSGVTAKADVTLGLGPVEVQEVPAMAESTMTHATVLARRVETEAGSMFNDSPVSSFPAPVDVQSGPLL
jgi:hypothetical protein